jgi:hypothetical protein
MGIWEFTKVVNIRRPGDNLGITLLVNIRRSGDNLGICSLVVNVERLGIS